MVDAGGTITTVAGTGTFGFSGDGGPATAARLNEPAGVDVDAAGNLYIADYANQRVRKVDTSGNISTVAGDGTAGFCGDAGPATSACIQDPTDVAADSAGGLYIADYGNNRIRKVSAGGTIRTVAGNGSSFYSGDGGQATSAGVASPIGVEVDAAGEVFVADSSSSRIRKVDAAGVITTVAGSGVFGFAGDGGPAVSAEMTLPARIAMNAAGDLFLVDTYNNRIRMVEGLGLLPGPELTGTTPASPANDNDPLVQGTATAGTTVTVYADPACTGPVAGSGTDTELASPGIAVSVPDDSTTSFYATSTSATGSVSACSMTPVVYVEDSTSPGAPTINIPPASPDSDLTPSWTFTTDAGATTECELTGPSGVLSPYAPCTSPATYDLTGEPDGSYIFRVRATDAAGNAGSPAANTYVLDSTVPAGPTITSSPADPSNDETPTWGFTVDPGSTAECEVSRGATILQAFSACVSPFTYDLTGEPNDDYTFRVLARDGAGNPSAPSSHTYTLDTGQPAAPDITSPPTSPGSSTAPSWSFTAEAGSTTQCELRRGGTVVSAWS
ncbi:MAG: hypothetical protein ACRDPR_14310, partial [Nocardioidaceae bacterium]